MKLRVWGKAPDFKAVDQNGKSHKLSDYKGKWLLLYFYPKDDTPGCTKEACNFRDSLDELKGKVGILGVSADSLESHKEFSDKYLLNFPILPDPEKKIIKDYDVLGIGGFVARRTSFLINPEGKIAKIYDNVNPDIHATQVMADLENFQK